MDQTMRFGETPHGGSPYAQFAEMEFEQEAGRGRRASTYHAASSHLKAGTHAGKQSGTQHAFSRQGMQRAASQTGQASARKGATALAGKGKLNKSLALSAHGAQLGMAALARQRNLKATSQAAYGAKKGPATQGRTGSQSKSMPFGHAGAQGAAGQNRMNQQHGMAKYKSGQIGPGHGTRGQGPGVHGTSPGRGGSRQGYPYGHPYGRRQGWPGIDGGFASSQMPGGDFGSQGSEDVRWAQDCLNQVMSTNIAVDGLMQAPVRSLIRSFQKRQGLRPSGILGPDTRAALQQACASAGDGAPDGSGPSEGNGDGGDAGSGGNGGNGGNGGGEGGGGDGQGGEGGEFELEFQPEAFEFAESRAGARQEAANPQGGAGRAHARRLRIVDLTARSDKTKRVGVRNVQDIRAVLLRQTGCCSASSDVPQHLLGFKAHYVILPGGVILQLHPLTALLRASSNGLHRDSVTVAFAGNFPDIRGAWQDGDRFGRDQVSRAQVHAARHLLHHLRHLPGLRMIFARRQTGGSHGNDPGPDIWSHVGQWAVTRLGFSDGGPDFKLHAGKAIPQVWRDWRQDARQRERVPSAPVPG
jgi:hypothetical protein